MPQHIVPLPPMVIVNGSSYSNAITLFDDASALTIFSPASLTGVVTIETEPTSTGTNFTTLQSGGSDVTLPAGKSTVINKIGWHQMRLASAATEAAARAFPVNKSVNV